MSKTWRPEAEERVSSSKQVDLLLINASNFPLQPIYPYAFVQVSAIARRHGVTVQRFDLFGYPKETWRAVLTEQLSRHHPRMIGIHLRQLDSLLLSHYATGVEYFPARDTREVVRLLRELTTSPILVGGFGFTSNARALMGHLEVDYGCNGSPDGIFPRFHDLLVRRELASIPNLIYSEGGQYRFHERVHHGPPGHREYDDAIIDELARFYGPRLHASSTTVAVEFSRGCPFQCYFCTEPSVKGRRWTYRNLDLVMEEVEFLASKGLQHLFMVCSELNLGGTASALAFAERLLKLNERRGQAIRWTAYTLPTLKKDELELLARSGYHCAWNDVQSLSDENLRRTRVPYRSAQVLEFQERLLDLDLARPARSERFISLFLGNLHTDPATVRETVRRFQEKGWSSRFDRAEIIPATRIFDRGNGPLQTDHRAMVVFDPERGLQPAGETPELIHPTFCFPPKLLEKLGTPEAILRFFRFIADTFLSRAHVFRRDWTLFLAAHLDEERLLELLRASISRCGVPDLDAWKAPLASSVRPLLAPLFRPEPDREQVRRLLMPPAEGHLAWNHAAATTANLIGIAHGEQFRPVLELLGLPEDAHGLSEYEVMRRLYARYDSLEELLARVRSGSGVEETHATLFCLRKFLYEKNVVLRPEYREWLFGPESSILTDMRQLQGRHP